MLTLTAPKAAPATDAATVGIANGGALAAALMRCRQIAADEIEMAVHAVECPTSIGLLIVRERKLWR